MIVLLLLISTLERGLTARLNVSAVSAAFTERLKTYDKRVRPYADSARLNLSMQLGVIGLGPIDATSLTLRVDFYFRNWWKDQRLNFGETEFNFNGDPSDLIWVPDTFGQNAIQTTQHKTLTVNTRTKLGPNGSVYSSARMTMISFCKMNLANYPFDEQTCNIYFESYSYTGREVYLEWKENKPPVEYIPNHVQLSGYELVGITGRRSDIVYDNGEIFPSLVAEIKLKRTFTYHLFSGYLPSSFLVVLTWATFWIPPRAVPARVTIIVTNFLSTIFVIQQEVGKIIRVDYITAVQVLLITNLVFILLAMVEYLIVLNVKDRTKETKLTVIANGLAEGIAMGNINDENGKQEGRNQSNEQVQKAKRFSAEDAHIVDYYSRIGIPVIYFIFVCAYVGYYKSKES